jgi:hypothetical protein
MKLYKYGPFTHFWVKKNIYNSVLSIWMKTTLSKCVRLYQKQGDNHSFCEYSLEYNKIVIF